MVFLRQLHSFNLTITGSVEEIPGIQTLSCCQLGNFHSRHLQTTGTIPEKEGEARETFEKLSKSTHQLFYWMLNLYIFSDFIPLKTRVFSNTLLTFFTEQLFITVLSSCRLSPTNISPLTKSGGFWRWASELRKIASAQNVTHVTSFTPIVVLVNFICKQFFTVGVLRMPDGSPGSQS